MELRSRLEDLINKRKEGLPRRDFYKGLISLLAELANSLKDEIERGDITDEQVADQIPLVLTILRDQIDLLIKREDK